MNLRRERIGQAVIGGGIGLVLVAAAVQGQIPLTADSTGSGLWIAIAGIGALFVGLRLALDRRPTGEAPARIAAPDAGSNQGSNAGSLAVLAAVGIVLIVIGWVARGPDGLGILLVSVPGWALTVPALIALAGELFGSRADG